MTDRKPAMAPCPRCGVAMEPGDHKFLESCVRALKGEVHRLRALNDSLLPVVRAVAEEWVDHGVRAKARAILAALEEKE